MCVSQVERCPEGDMRCNSVAGYLGCCGEPAVSDGGESVAPLLG